MDKALEQISKSTVDRLIEKSQEAFLLAIELYNRPSIKYHVEGCAFFLCNAWELMLKARMILDRGIESIYYPNGDRTLSLDDCLKIIFPNENDPLRKNMDRMIEVRNTSTHFIVPEYESFYTPLLQACVENYDVQLRALLGIEISDRIPENYLVLSVRRSMVDEDECRVRYDQKVLERMLERQDGIVTTADELDNRKFCCSYTTELRSTKKADADFSFRVVSDGKQPVALVKTLVEAKNKYPYRPGMVVKEICKRITRNNLSILQDGIAISSKTKGGKPFNLWVFGLFCSFYGMKGDPRYSYDTSMEGENPSYIYSQQAIDLIWDKLREDPSGVVDRLKRELKK